jgi:hypothetical protein
MKIVKKILIVLAILVIIGQFIRPPQNTGGDVTTNDIATRYVVPPQVQTILRTSCYDCHSNATMYPWYAHVQPAGWYLYNHIKDAKKDLNFSEFCGYPLRRQIIKLQQVVEQVNENEMPLPSYLILHQDAKLTAQQKEVIADWANTLRDSLKQHYAGDKPRPRD